MQNYRYDNRSSLGGKKKRRRAAFHKFLAILCLVILGMGLGCGIFFGYHAVKNWVDSVMNDPTEAPSVASSSETVPESTAPRLFTAELENARRLAASYDYDAAIDYIKTISGYETESKLTDAIAYYLGQKSQLVKYDISKVYHVFFHSLIADPKLAFSSDEKNGYNQVMTTVSEFNAMMEQMYARGFVLVSLHDMAYTNAEGKFVSGSIMLPADKKAFVLSVDDMVYYEYMTGDGFANRLVIDEDGMPQNEMKLEDGRNVTGAFDVVPLLEQFIAQHPDFSYKGAKGAIALTGYDGIMGYRTAPKYGDSTNPDYKKAYASIDLESERKQAAAVASRLKALGWEFASHSWGHVDMSKASLDWIVSDTEKWNEQVNSLLGGDCDIMIYAYGADIGSWKNYNEDNEKFTYLKSMGFNYFCNVDAYTIPWVQFSSSQGYLRQGRVNLDGYEMYYHPDKLEVFFDVSQVFDSARPLPVPDY